MKTSREIYEEIQSRKKEEAKPAVRSSREIYEEIQSRKTATPKVPTMRGIGFGVMKEPAEGRLKSEETKKKEAWVKSHITSGTDADIEKRKDEKRKELQERLKRADSFEKMPAIVSEYEDYNPVIEDSFKNAIHQAKTNVENSKPVPLKRGFGNSPSKWLQQTQESKKILDETIRLSKESRGYAYDDVWNIRQGAPYSSNVGEIVREITVAGEGEETKKRKDALTKALFANIALENNELDIMYARMSGDKDKEKELKDEREHYKNLKTAYESFVLATNPDFEKYVAVGEEASKNDTLILTEQLKKMDATKEEIDIFKYLYGKYGKEKAYEYSNAVWIEFWNERKGKNDAKWHESLPWGIREASYLGDAFLSGGINAIEGIEAFFTGEEKEIGPADYERMYIDEALSKKGLKIGDKTLGQYLYGGAEVVGNMAPALLFTVATKGAGAPAAVSSIGGSTLMGLSAAGHKVAELKAQGYSDAEAYSVGTLVGASEAALQTVIGGISKLGGVSSGKYAAKIAAADRAVTRVLGTAGLKIGAEITEEELQLFLEPLFETVILGKEYDAPEAEEMIYTAIVTALSTGTLESGEIIAAGKNKKVSPVIDKGSETSVAEESDLGYNQSGIDEGSVISGREVGDGRDRRLREEISGKSDTESDSSYGRIEAGISEQRSTEGIGREGLFGQDSEGREINETTEENLRNTVVRDENGRAKAVYHYTQESEFTSFEKSKDIGFHFGNENQATVRKTDLKKENGRVFRVYLNLKNPIRVSKDIMSWKAHGTALKLWSDGILTDSEMNEVTSLEVDGYDSPAAVRLREMLAEKGYDGIVYPNGFEGDGDSYIAFSDDQIIKTEIQNVGEGLNSQQNKTEEAVDVADTSAASSAYPGDLISAEKPSPSATLPPLPEGEASGDVDATVPRVETPGFVKTEWSAKIGNRTIRALDAIGKRIGVEIRIGPPTGTGKGADNGKYENGVITIAQDAGNPLAVVLAHEVTHHMKRTAPEEYRKFLELAISVSEKLSGAEKSELIERYSNAYSEGAETEFSETEALDEIAADYAGRIVRDLSLFDKLVKSSRNVAQRFLDGVKSFIAKVKATFSKDKTKADTASLEKYGATVSELETAVKQWEKMLAVTEAGVRDGSINTVGTDADGVKYSLKSFENGVRFVDVQTDQHLFDELSDNDKGRMATKIIKERFAGKVVGRDNKVFVNGRSAAEYGHPTKRISGVEYDAKMRASTELDNLIDAGRNFRTEPDGRDGHIHPQATGDFKYFDTIFKVGEEYFEGIINILPNKRGDLLTDITQIKNITQDISSSYGKNPKSTFLRDNSEDINSSNNSIPDSTEKSNPQKSLKTPDLLSRDYKAPERSVSESGDGEVDVDKYFNEAEKRAQVIEDKRIEDAESALMKSPKVDAYLIFVRSIAF